LSSGQSELVVGSIAIIACFDGIKKEGKEKKSKIRTSFALSKRFCNLTTLASFSCTLSRSSLTSSEPLLAAEVDDFVGELEEEADDFYFLFYFILFYFILFFCTCN